MSRINSNQKGKAGERELARLIRSYGYDNARRGQQYKGSSDSPDVVGLPHIYMECKRVQNLQLVNALELATEECAGTDELPAVFHRENYKEWKVTMWEHNFFEIFTHWFYGTKQEPLYDILVTHTAESPVLRLDEWLGRAKLCVGDGNAKPALIYSRPNEEKTITLYLDDWIEFYREWEAGKSL